jgi:hypothetical protein
MDLWDSEDLDLLGPATLEVAADGAGSMRFLAVEADVDGRHVLRDGRVALEFSWVGHDECDDATGRGWAILRGDGQLEGRVFFHGGDDSGFVAVRTTGAG